MHNVRNMNIVKCMEGCAPGLGFPNNIYLKSYIKLPFKQLWLIE